MKSTFETRPVHVRNREHISAHLPICLISLIILRVVQQKIIEFQKESQSSCKEKNMCEMGLSGDRIQKALNRWTVDILPTDLLRFNYIDDPDLKLILDSLGIDLKNKLYNSGRLIEIKQTI